MSLYAQDNSSDLADFQNLLPALAQVDRSAVAANQVDFGGQANGDGYPFQDAQEDETSGEIFGKLSLRINITC